MTRQSINKNKLIVNRALKDLINNFKKNKQDETKQSSNLNNFIEKNNVQDETIQCSKKMYDLGVYYDNIKNYKEMILGLNTFYKIYINTSITRILLLFIL